MHRKIHKVIKQGEAQFGRDVKQLFEERKALLLEQLKRLETRQKEGWGYKRILRRAYTVRAHKVRSHWATIPVKRR